MGGTRQMWKVRLMVCLDVLNRLKIRMKNMDSEVFLFSSSKEIKTDRKKIYCSPYTSRKCWRWTLRSYLLLLISFFPWFFPCCCRFFSSLPIFSFLSFFFLFFLWILVYFSADRFSVWVFKPFFLTFPSCEAPMFLLMFMVPPFDVLNILIGHIVFYTFVISGALLRRSLSFTTSFAVHIFCFHISIVIFSPIQGFFWNQHRDQL